MDEESLFSQWQAYKEARETLWLSFQDFCKVVAYKKTRDESWRDDLAQAASEKAINAAHTFNPLEGALSAWLRTITQNTYIDYIRQGRHELPIGEIEEGANLPTINPKVEILVEETELVQRIHQIINDLSHPNPTIQTRCQIVARANIFYEMKDQAIADLLGWRVDTIKHDLADKIWPYIYSRIAIDSFFDSYPKFRLVMGEKIVRSQKFITFITRIKEEFAITLHIEPTVLIFAYKKTPYDTTQGKLYFQQALENYIKIPLQREIQNGLDSRLTRSFTGDGTCQGCTDKIKPGEKNHLIARLNRGATMVEFVPGAE